MTLLKRALGIPAPVIILTFSAARTTCRIPNGPDFPSSIVMKLLRAGVGLAAVASLALLPSMTWACACGCGVFDVGGGTLIAMPSGSETGWSAWFRYSYMNQNQNWEGTSRAPASDNTDKDVNTNFFTLGGQYVINRDWSVMAELPIYYRRLTTTDDGTVNGPAGSIYTADITAMGDLQLTAIYTGLLSDMSLGLTFGLWLPTGDYTGPTGSLGGYEFDRDTVPGTGATSLTIGGYYVGGITTDNRLAYFLQARYVFAVFTRNDYRPGGELDGAVGLTYTFDTGANTSITPLLQAKVSYRTHDTGSNADQLNSGYTRLLVGPGVEARLWKVRLYADVEFPIYQYVNAASSVAVEGTAGQLVASVLVNAVAAYDF